MAISTVRSSSQPSAASIFSCSSPCSSSSFSISSSSSGSAKRALISLKRSSSVLRLGQPLQHVPHHRQLRIEMRLLRQIAHLGAFRGPGLAGEVGIEAGHDLQQRRLAGAVDADHADLGAGKEGEGDPLQHLAAAGIGARQPFHHVDVLIGGHRLSPRGMNQGKRQAVFYPAPGLVATGAPATGVQQRPFPAKRHTPSPPSPRAAFIVAGQTS